MALRAQAYAAPAPTDRRTDARLSRARGRPNGQDTAERALQRRYRRTKCSHGPDPVLRPHGRCARDIQALRGRASTTRRRRPFSGCSSGPREARRRNHRRALAAPRRSAGAQRAIPSASDDAAVGDPIERRKNELGARFALDETKRRLPPQSGIRLAEPAHGFLEIADGVHGRMRDA
jgi:hypothetical protein